jgi:hypothetical protein
MNILLAALYLVQFFAVCYLAIIVILGTLGVFTHVDGTFPNIGDKANRSKHREWVKAASEFCDMSFRVCIAYFCVWMIMSLIGIPVLPYTQRIITIMAIISGVFSLYFFHKLHYQT